MAVMCEGRIVPFFTLEEMANNNAKESVRLKLDTEEAIEHAWMMNELRVWAVSTYPAMFKKGLHVSSWYRTQTYNDTLEGSSPKSTHLDGRATDVDNIPATLYDEFTVAWQVICSIHKKIGGCNYYVWGMHFDSYEDKFGYTTFQTREYRK